MMPTTLMSGEEFRGLGAPDLVYVREVKASDLLEEAVEMKDVAFDPNQSLYAVHSADGERLAVMLDRDTAFAAAVAHELEPVSVH
jgi:hypothetical protein